VASDPYNGCGGGHPLTRDGGRVRSPGPPRGSQPADRSHHLIAVFRLFDPFGQAFQHAHAPRHGPALPQPRRDILLQPIKVFSVVGPQHFPAAGGGQPQRQAEIRIIRPGEVRQDSTCRQCPAHGRSVDKRCLPNLGAPTSPTDQTPTKPTVALVDGGIGVRHDRRLLVAARASHQDLTGEAAQPLQPVADAIVGLQAIRAALHGLTVLPAVKPSRTTTDNAHGSAATGQRRRVSGDGSGRPTTANNKCQPTMLTDTAWSERRPTA